MVDMIHAYSSCCKLPSIASFHYYIMLNANGRKNYNGINIYKTSASQDIHIISRNISEIFPLNHLLNTNITKLYIIISNGKRMSCTLIDFSCTVYVKVYYKIRESQNIYGLLRGNRQHFYSDQEFPFTPIDIRALRYVSKLLYNKVKTKDFQSKKEIN